MDEEFGSFVVTDPDLVDEGIDVSGLRTQTDTSLLGNIPDFAGIQYEAFNPNRLSDLMRLYSTGLPMIDTAQVPGAIDTLVTGGGGSGDGGQATLPIDTIQPIDTPIITDLTDDQINEFATEDTTMPPMLSSDMVGGIDTTPSNMSPLADEQFVDTTSGLDDLDINLIDQPFSDTPVTLGSGNNALGLTDPQSLAIGPSGAVDFNTGGLEDYLDDATLTSAQAPQQLDTSEIEQILADETLPSNYPQEDLTIGVTEAIDPQAVNTILGPDGITYDAVTGQPILDDPIMDPNLMEIRQQQNVVTQEDVDNPTNLLQKLGIPEDFDIKKALIDTGINLVAGVPITLIAKGLEAVLPDDNIAPSTNTARNTGLLQGDNTVTQDIYGINTQTSFNPVKSTKNYNDYNVEQVAKLENVLDDLKNNKYKGDEQSYLDNTKRLRQELEDRKEYLDAINKDPLYGGDIDAITTGDAQIAEETIGTLPEITEARQKQGEQIQEIQQQEVVQSGSDEADRQQRDTGVAKVSENRYETKSGDVYASASEAAEKSDGGGGGSSSSKIVCTMMNESYGFGSFRNKIWLKHSKGLAPEYQKGYHKIFLPLVKLSKKNFVLKKVLEHIAVHRTIDIRQESRGKVHLLGRVYRKILEPICYFVGKHV
jgi:hypothetical protein